MRIKNVRDKKGFLERLNGCEGQVYLINSDGTIISLNGNEKQGKGALTSSFMKGNLNNTEISFSEIRDIFYMAEYVFA